MRTIDFILKKRKGEAFTKQEINVFISRFAAGEIPDYQVAAWLMAVYFKGINDDELVWLTDAMTNSGKQIDLSAIPGIKVDKHSTGGVADTTTLIVAPLVAAAGIPVAKMSGRGLGHTGGTIDKLEAIPGFDTSLTIERFINQVKDVGLAVIGQTVEVAPADGKLYALRDVTGTVDSIPLIASSIMSKKIASGADKIVLDVKYGRGAFMEKLEDAIILAKAMVEIGSRVERETIALITCMEEPLGQAIGNTLEVIEAIEVLKNNGPDALKQVSLLIGAYMLLLGGGVKTVDEALHKLEKLLASGEALKQFTRFIVAQGGDAKVVENYMLLPQATICETILSEQSGWLQDMNAVKVGIAAGRLGAGREVKGQPIDLSVGIFVHKRVGQMVQTGDPLFTIYANDVQRLQSVRELLQAAATVGPCQYEQKPLIAGVVDCKGYKSIKLI